MCSHNDLLCNNFVVLQYFDSVTDNLKSRGVNDDFQGVYNLDLSNMITQCVRSASQFSQVFDSMPLSYLKHCSHMPDNLSRCKQGCRLAVNGRLCIAQGNQYFVTG